MPDLDLRPDKDFVSIPVKPMVRKRDFVAGMAVFVPVMFLGYGLAWYTNAWAWSLLALPCALWIGTLCAGRFPQRFFRHLEMVKRSDR